MAPNVPLTWSLNCGLSVPTPALPLEPVTNILKLPAPSEIAILLLWVEDLPAYPPITTFPPPVVISVPAAFPKNTLLSPVETESPAVFPIAILDVALFN